MGYATGGTGASAVSGRSAPVGAIGASTAKDSPAGAQDGSTSSSQSDTSAAASGSTSTAGDGASTSSAPVPAASPASAAAAALSAGAAVAGTASTPARAESVAGGLPPVDLADSADKLMTQVVQTIHTYQTSAGPTVEARINDANLGDVRLVVTGRAGEIVQAQLVVHDRVAADAIEAAAARIHAAGDALAGVNVTVRSDGGGSATGGRAGSNPFEAAGWTAGGGYGPGGNSSSGGGHGQGLGDQNAAAAGNGTGQQRTGDGSQGTARPAPAARPESSKPNRPMPRVPLQGGSSVDIRA